MMMMNARKKEGFAVLFGYELFWARLNSLPAIGLLRVAVAREPIDLAFAVRQMPSVRDKQVTKMWAHRWLGLSLSWLTKTPRLTLAMALAIMGEHGGLSKTHARGLKLREKEAVLRVKREAFKAGKADRREAAHKLLVQTYDWLSNARKTKLMSSYHSFDSKLIRRLTREKSTIEEIGEALLAEYAAVRAREEKQAATIRMLDAWLDSEDLPSGGAFFDQCVRDCAETMTDEMKAEFRRVGAHAKARVATQRRLNARLQAENLPRVGHYYQECILQAREPTDEVMAEFRFRNAVWNNPRYDAIVERLALHGHYAGIHADARTLFRRRYQVDADGRIGGLNPAYTTFNNDVLVMRVQGGAMQDDMLMSEDEDDE